MSYVYIEINEKGFEGELEIETHPHSYSEDHEYGTVDYDYDYSIGEVKLDDVLLTEEQANTYLDNLYDTDEFEEQVREICREVITDRFHSEP